MYCQLLLSSRVSREHMKRILTISGFWTACFVLLFLFCFVADFCLPPGRQTPRSREDSFTGTWKVEDVAFAPWTFTLRAGGNKVTGTVSQRGLDPQEAPAICGGAIEGNQITFKCDSADGGRTITFSGVVAGDSITFAREVNVHPGQWPGMRGVYGAYGPSHFTARRAYVTAGSRAGSWKKSIPPSYGERLILSFIGATAATAAVAVVVAVVYYLRRAARSLRKGSQ